MSGTIGCGTIGSGTIGNACPTTTAPTATGGGNKHEPSPQTQAYWETERQRLALVRDDEETLLVVI